MAEPKLFCKDCDKVQYGGAFCKWCGGWKLTEELDEVEVVVIFTLNKQPIEWKSCFDIVGTPYLSEDQWETLAQWAHLSGVSVRIKVDSEGGVEVIGLEDD